MVLEREVGKRRSFWRGFLLTVVSFGIYAIYWNYKAHDEVFKQFELERQGEDEGIVFLILGVILTPFLWIYQYKFVENVNRVRREELDMEEGVSSVEFLLWETVGILLLFLGPVIAYYKLQGSINDIWEAHEAEVSAESPAEGPAAT